MNKILLLLLLIFSAFTTYSQNKIDKLIKNYGENELILYTTEGELVAKPVIIKNSDGLPYSIKIEGKNTDSKRIAAFFLSLFMDKEEEGFNLSESNRALKFNMNKGFINDRILNGEEGIDVEYTNENYLFKAISYSYTEFFNTKTGAYLIDGDSYNVDEYHNIRREIFYKFEIEMIDNTRIGVSKSRPFKF